MLTRFLPRLKPGVSALLTYEREDAVAFVAEEGIRNNPYFLFDHNTSYNGLRPRAHVELVEVRTQQIVDERDELRAGRRAQYKIDLGQPALHLHKKQAGDHRF